MSFCEYLRRLYIKELYLILGLSIPLSIFLCLQLKNHWLGTAVIVGCIPAAIELLLLYRKKNITTHNSLVIPRTLHFIAYYIIIMSVSLVYTPFRFEYLLFVPLGISATAFHPFFGKKLKDILFAFGLVSALGLFAFEFTTENFIAPLGIENYTMIGYVFLLTAIFIYQANVTNERSKVQHKQDKTSLEKQLAVLKELTAERDQITYKLISDFRRTIIDMDADFELIEKKTDDLKTIRITHNGRKNAKLLSQFIDNYTQGRIEAYQAMSIEHVDLNRLIVTELNRHHELLQAHNIDLDYVPYEGDLFFSDEKRIKTIIQNLIQNAVDYSDATKENSKLHVSVRAKSNAIELLVSDNGVGVKNENLPHIFKIFYTTKKASEGKGLYVVKKAIEAVGADIKIKSTWGKGTTVRASIPNMRVS